MMVLHDIMEIHMDLVRKQTYITVEQDHRLREVARRHGTTEAEILRRALDSWLAAEETSEGADPFADLLGFVSGPPEVDHDDIYR